MMTEANPIDVLRSRGFVQDVTDESGLRDLLDSESVVFYYGMDPTALSLHVGNLVGLMAMAWLQRLGHVPIALAGGATGRIGDPSGRDSERELLSEEQLERNLDGIRVQASRFVDLSKPGARVVDNFDWTRDVTLLDFLRDVGKHFSVNTMIARESVKRRLETREQGLSFTEFSYQLLQAFDFSVLSERYGCRLQVGGSDQWGNITAGVDLTRRRQGAQVFGLVWPLVTRSDGAKFGKSAGGETIWLDADLTSPFAYYQWFLNIPDADVGPYLKLFTFLDMDEIEELVEALTRDPAAREAHGVLAREATRIVHGDEGVEAAERATDALFGGGTLAGLDDRVLADAFEEAPSIELPRTRLDDGLGLLELMTEVGASRSNGEARRLVQQGGVRVNNALVDDPALRLTPDDLAGASTLVLKVGKRRHYLARFR